jgi:hypothetical protein
MSPDSAGPPEEKGSKPIRVVLPTQQASPPSPVPVEPELEEERITPQTGLVLGLIITVALLAAALPTVVFFVLACVLAILHREAVRPEKPLEDYARIIPERVEQLFHRLGHPDGRLILLVLLLAAAVYLVHQIVFGLAGAAALITALYLLDWLDRPAGVAMKWFSTHEEAWAGSLRAWLNPVACHVLAIVSLIPILNYLAAVFLPRNLPGTPSWVWGISGGVVLVLFGLRLLRKRGDSRTGEQAQEPAQDTLLVSTAALILGVVCAAVMMALRLQVPFLADPLEWNGLGLAFLPALALTFWCGRYLHRARGEAGETSTWRFSAIAALILAGTGFLLARALQLEDRGLVRPGSAGLFAFILVGWLFAARLLVGLTRSKSEHRIPEWTTIYLATMASLIIAFFMTYFGGLWGLVLAVPPILGVWKAVAPPKPVGGISETGT